MFNSSPLYIRLCYCIISVVALVACHSASVPENCTKSESLPDIYPDYVDVTIPVNIAPLTFMMNSEADEMVARLSFGDEEMVLGGDKIQPDVDDWHNLLQQAQGKDITVEVYARQTNQIEAGTKEQGIECESARIHLLQDGTIYANDINGIAER